MDYKFNINNGIKVKLSEEGFKHWMYEDNKTFYGNKDLQKYIHPLSWYKARADENGYVTFQAWHFIKIFGSSIDMTAPQIFETDILINESSLMPSIEQGVKESDTTMLNSRNQS